MCLRRRVSHLCLFHLLAKRLSLIRKMDVEGLMQTMVVTVSCDSFSFSFIQVQVLVLVLVFGPYLIYYNRLEFA